MTLSAALLPEFDQEMGSTRRTLERIPEDRLQWSPHEKSMTFAGLATHICNVPRWGMMTLELDHFDLAESDDPHMSPVGSVAEALATFDDNVAAARAAIENASDEHWQQPWSLLSGSETHFTLPRSVVVRSMVMNHMIHHRAQLGVYLRLCEVPVPASYGPSADERP